MGGAQATKKTAVVWQGSDSDNVFTKPLIEALRAKGFSVENRIASVDNTPTHAQAILDIYERRFINGEELIFVTVAGKRDALSGVVAARGFTAVACPPDAEKGSIVDQAAKEWMTTNIPKGTVIYTKNVPAAVAKTVEAAESLNREQTLAAFESARKKREAIKLADAALQGVGNPLPYTFMKAGKVRIVYIDGDYLILDCSDDISAFEAKGKRKIPGKGKYLNKLSAYWFELTGDVVPNHFIAMEGETAMRVKKTDRINIEFIIRGNIYGSMWRAYEKGQREFYGVTLPDGLKMGDKLPEPMVTPTTKEERKGFHDEPISKEEAVKQGLCTTEEWDICSDYTRHIYDTIVSRAAEVGLMVPDFKLEFGKLPDGTIILIDEMPTHDSARFWQASKFEPGKPQEAWCLDKEFFRQYLIKMGFDIKGTATELPDMPDLVVDQIERRVRGAYEVFVEGKKLEDLGLMSVDEVVEAVKRQQEQPVVESPAAA